MKSSHSHQPAGFTLPELITLVAVLGLLAVVAVSKFSTVQAAVVETKLRSEVTKLNSLIAVYQAAGGSLTNAASPQDVIDRLKTTQASANGKITVGPVTGREVDVRLATRMQTASEAATNSPRAVWNQATTKFAVKYSGADGVASFLLDDALAQVRQFQKFDRAGSRS